MKENKKMKRVITSIIQLTISSLVTICFFISPTYAQYGGGTGEPNDPYLIYTAEQMNAIGTNKGDWDKHFKLMADIDLSGFDGKEGRPEFNKIAPDTDMVNLSYQGIPFAGVFNGDGHTISNLTLDGGVYVGLFCRVASGGQIKNLGLIDVKINDSGHVVGGLVAWNEGDVTDCYSIGTISGSGWASSVGGLVGYNRSGNMIQCYSSGAVSGEWNVGGLVGNNEGDLTNCYSTSTISCIESHGAGGLVGCNDWRGTVTHCYATGDVSGHNYVGGLGGLNCGVVTACNSIGAVTGDDYVGGLVGANPGIVIRCFSTGTVSGRDYVGGLVGGNYDTEIGGLAGCNSGNVVNSYGTGLVSGTGWNVGGLVGRNDGGEVACSFWDTQTSGQTTSAGGIGLITSEMQMTATFLEAGWDFVDETVNGTYDIWWILEGRDYPRLSDFSKSPQLQPFPAFCPYPQDGAKDIRQLLILSWAPGGPTLQHDVYFSENEQAVTNATTTSPGIYRGRQAAELTTYDMDILGWDKTYYWRIDEVDEDDPNNSWKGNVWSFTTAEFLVVDDFESYSELCENFDCNRIWMTWIDGFDKPENGSIVGYEYYFPMHTIVHSGKQSMPYSYDNSGTANYSEATMTLVYPRDWTIEGVAVLSLWFRGSPTNTPEPMYVALNGIAVVYNDNPNAALINTWIEWTIDLQEFADQGVNLANVNTITIGFGHRINPVAGGKGEMWFDDIRLYRPTSQKLAP
jgi:hypothetical protein